MNIPKVVNAGITLLLAVALILSGIWVHRWLEEGRILRQVIDRLSADSRAAEVLVTKSEFDEDSKKIKTTIKFLEYDSAGKPLTPKYFTFHGNIIQFQSFVIRFQDDLVKAGDKLKGKSIYLFMKAFVLDGEKTQSFTITETDEIPRGYQIGSPSAEMEKELWKYFWDYALNPEAKERTGIKNAQIEAPGTMFLPGTIYTLKIEHDGGLRIDTQPIPEVLKGEIL